MKQIFSALVGKLKEIVQIFKLTKPANRVAGLSRPGHLAEASKPLRNRRAHIIQRA